MEQIDHFAGGKVIAKVNNNIYITEEKLQQVIQSMPSEQRLYFDNEEGSKLLLDELIDLELIYVDAMYNKLDKSPQFETLLKEAKRDLLKQFAIQSLFETVTVTDKECQAYYKENLYKYSVDEKIQVAHILVKTMEKANGLIQKLNEGEQFEDLARKHSLCPSSVDGGDLGMIERGKMLKSFEDAAFMLPIGVVSQPVQSEMGFHIILVSKRMEGRILPLDEVITVIKSQIEKGKRNKVYQYHLEEIKKTVQIERFSH